MARVKTFTNGGSLLPSDLNSIEDDYEFAFSTYKDIFWTPPNHLDAAAASSVNLNAFGVGGTTVPPALPCSAYTAALLYLDPADRTANARVTKYRIVAECLTNAVSPGGGWTATVGLYAVATWGGASGSTPTIATLNVVPVSSVPTLPGGANAQSRNAGADFNAPAAGWYVLTAAWGAMAANSYATIRGVLQQRQV